MSPLVDLHGEGPEIAELLSWPAVARFVAHRGIRTEHADCVLRPLARDLSAKADARLSTIFLLMFMPSLIALQWARRGWLPAADERWSRVCWCFARSLGRLNPS